MLHRFCVFLCVWFCCVVLVLFRCSFVSFPAPSYKSCGVFQVSVEGHWTYSRTYVLVLQVSLRLFNLDCRYPLSSKKKNCCTGNQKEAENTNETISGPKQHFERKQALKKSRTPKMEALFRRKTGDMVRGLSSSPSARAVSLFFCLVVGVACWWCLVLFVWFLCFACAVGVPFD